MEEVFSVYLATGPTGVYVGETDDFARRFRDHRRSAKKPKHHFARALAKYGFDAFSWEIILQSKNNKDALKCEEDIVAQFKSEGVHVYNETDGGEGLKGHNFSPEHREKIGAVRRGKPVSEEHAARLRSYNENRKPQSEETRLKRSEARKAFLAQNGSPAAGIKLSDAARQNIVEGLKKRYAETTPEQRKAQVAVALSRLTPEQRSVNAQKANANRWGKTTPEERAEFMRKVTAARLAKKAESN